MFMSIALAMVLGVPGDEPAKKDVPVSKELFANEDWYKGQEGKEQSFEGILKYQPRGEGVVGFGRYNPFTLRMIVDRKPTFREVYVGGKDELLKPYVGKALRLTGKPVDMEVEGTMHREIWPARLEVLTDDKDRPKEDKGQPGGGEVKILGRSPLRMATRPGGAAQQVVIRSAEEFAKLGGAGKPEAALDNLGKQMKASIDWSKHMLIVVTGGVQRTGGYRVEITGISIKGNTMTVRWKLHSPPPGSFVTMALTHPAETVLVERFAGKVVFDPPAGK